jgi:FAD synthetase
MSSKRILAGGCFNLIHRGHLYFLKEAKKLGNELIVVLAHDKNNKKPYAVPAKIRKKELERLGIANKVLIGNFNDKTKLVRELKPNVIALGYDQDLPLGLDEFKHVRIKKLDGYSTALNRNPPGSEA